LQQYRQKKSNAQKFNVENDIQLEMTVPSNTPQMNGIVEQSFNTAYKDGGFATLN
jgi:hypothetical protein